MSLGKKLLSPVIWVNLIAMALVAVLIVVGVWMGLGRYTHHGEQISVPNVENKFIGDAEYTLGMEELTAVVVDSSYNRSLPSGIVISQQPKAGSLVKSGREIYLTINAKQSPTIALPDIADNSSLREAQDRLRQLGFRLGPIEEVPGDRDWIYGVKYQGRLVYAGERVPADAVLTLLVGTNKGNEDEADFDLDDDMDGEDEYGDSELFDYE